MQKSDKPATREIKDILGFFWTEIEKISTEQ